MGLLCARDHKFPNAKFSGFTKTPFVAFVPSESHHSVEIAANTLGMGTDNLIAVESDHQGKMNINSLKRKISEQKDAGKIPFCVIGSIGHNRPAEHLDPLPEIAEICAEENIYHVDAAWGGAALLSPETRNLMQGIEHSNSFCWGPTTRHGDAYQPARHSWSTNKMYSGEVCSHSNSAH